MRIRCVSGERNVLVNVPCDDHRGSISIVFEIEALTLFYYLETAAAKMCSSLKESNKWTSPRTGLVQS